MHPIENKINENYKKNTKKQSLYFKQRKSEISQFNMNTIKRIFNIKPSK